MGRQLYYASNANDSDVPWEMENEWALTINLDWQNWLFGVARHGDTYSAVWGVHLGPISLTYYHRN